jgi:hypothetical protein
VNPAGSIEAIDAAVDDVVVAAITVRSCTHPHDGWPSGQVEESGRPKADKGVEDSSIFHEPPFNNRPSFDSDNGGG